ncbi:MAG: Crp/Fnr family transcriptional regulator [Acidimicrobiales bacterium]
MSNYLEALQPDTLTSVASRGRRKHFGPKEWIFSRGADSTTVLFIESGLVRVERPTAGGRTVLLDLASSGATIGELGAITGRPRSASIVAVEASTVIALDAAEFNAMLDERADLNRFLMQAMAERIVALTGQLVEASGRSATARISARLVELLDRSDQRSLPQPRLGLPLSQEELGQWAGLSREGTAKALRELREADVIRTGRLQITILDPESLRSSARDARES